MKLKRLSVLLIFVIVISCFGGCAAATEIDARTITAEFLDLLIQKDYSAAYEYFSGVDKESFYEFCGRMSAELEGVEEFSLKQTKWSRTTKNGVTYYSYTFEMSTHKDKGYVVETVYLAEDDSFYTFNIIGQTALSSTEIMPFKLITIALSLASIGFCVWMVVDCAKRNVRKKALWIILILCGFAFTVTFGYNFGINFSLMLALPLWQVTSDSLCTSIKASVPLGAIIYCILRNKITIPPLFHEVQFTDITENNV